MTASIWLACCAVMWRAAAVPASETHSPSLVCSHGATGHKYGLVYPGLGWVIWRDAKNLPGESSAQLASSVSQLCFVVVNRMCACHSPTYLFIAAESMVLYENYLGTLERSITLNFSKPATNIIAQ